MVSWATKPCCTEKLVFAQILGLEIIALIMLISVNLTVHVNKHLYEIITVNVWFFCVCMAHFMKWKRPDTEQNYNFCEISLYNFTISMWCFQVMLSFYIICKSPIIGHLYHGKSDKHMLIIIFINLLLTQNIIQLLYIT